MNGLSLPPATIRASRLSLLRNWGLLLINVSLLILLPIAWYAPLITTGLGTEAMVSRVPPVVWNYLIERFPVFALKEVSIMGAVSALWGTDRFLASVIFSFAVIVPYLKTSTLLLIHLGLLPQRLQKVLSAIGRWAMLDIFLVAILIVVMKGTGFYRIQIESGLYLFSACVLLSVFASLVLFDRETGLGLWRRCSEPSG